MSFKIIINWDVGSKTTFHYANQVVLYPVPYIILSCFGTNVPHYMPVFRVRGDKEY
jgi:hypothetical protein